jgi:hypothetical protein
MSKKESMITEDDKDIIDDIQEHIDSIAFIGETKVDWEKVKWKDTLTKLVDNLNKAPLSFKVSDNHTVECINCGWWGSSKLLNGGGQIADTGDYFDSTCPVCDSDEIDEKIIISSIKPPRARDLSKFLTWVENSTHFFQDKDVTINQIVDEYFKK